MNSLYAAVLACLFGVLLATNSPPKVQVYTRYPGFYDKGNVLICHVSGFQPPQIMVEMQKNNVIIPGSNESDLAFDDLWQFHLTKSVEITPKEGDRYTCKVRHLGDTKSYTWEADI